MQREKKLNDVNIAIQGVISSQPKFAGLNSYVGVETELKRSWNGSNIYLSYGNRQDALNTKKQDTPACEYPVWKHFEFDPLLNMGNGGINYKNVTNLQSASIEANIARSLPISSSASSSSYDRDVHMRDASRDTGPSGPSYKVERAQLVHLGLTHLLLHSFRMFGSGFKGPGVMTNLNCFAWWRKWRVRGT